MSDRQSVRTPAWMTLAPGERVLLRARPSTNLVLAGVVGGFLLITVGALPFVAANAVTAGRRVTFALVVFVLLFVAVIFLLIRRREYVLTSERASVAIGVTSKEVRSVDLDDVREVSLEQGRWKRWANVGDLRFVTDGGEDLAFGFVGNPHFVYERTLEVL